MTRYDPRGYVFTEAAILSIARARSPDTWAPSAISAREAAVWDGINKTFNGLVLDPRLFFEIPNSERVEAQGRLVEFMEALNELRRALHAGLIVAEFSNEHGHFDYIQKHGWGVDAGVEVLLSGVADLDYGHEVWRRLVLIPETPLHNLIHDPEAFWGSAKSVPQGHGQGGAMFRTSAAGRPSSMHLILREAKRRVGDPQYPTTNQKGFAMALSEWLSDKHPDAPPTTPKTMINNSEFRALHREFKASRNQPPEISEEG